LAVEPVENVVVLLRTHIILASLEQLSHNHIEFLLESLCLDLFGSQEQENRTINVVSHLIVLTCHVLDYN
jgi:hypothetical protein